MSNAVLGFGSWCRRGAAVLIENTTVPSPRVVLNTELLFQQTGLSASETIELYGPGEITGFDARTVTRTWPGRSVKDAEQYSFAHIEFDQADLPWRYTPFRSGAASDQKSQEHVLLFKSGPTTTNNPTPLPQKQQFSNDGAWWVWGQTPPPLAVTDPIGVHALMANFVTSGVLGSVDFDEPALSIEMPFSRTFNESTTWIPTLVLEGFAGANLVQRIEIPLDGMHSTAFKITAPATSPMTRFVMSVTVPTTIAPTPGSPNAGFQFGAPPRVEFDIASITYVTAPEAIQGDGLDRLRPWFVLIVLRPEEIIDYSPAASHPPTNVSAADPLPLSVVRTRQSSLPDLSQSWAWGHVQVSGRPTITPAEAETLFETAPQTMISRLICPRQLDPAVAWRAFLVPAFERGRLAGLGLPKVDAAGVSQVVGAAVPAWGILDPNGVVADTEVVLPVYYEWEFQTAANVDFESLVRLLNAEPLPADVGTRQIDAYSPDPALPPASVEPLSIEGALKAAAPAPAWQAGQRAVFVPKLTDLLNDPKALLEGNGTPLVAPPLYGRWFAARDHLEPAGSGWFDTLNADPRYRVASGAASQIVQEQEDKILAGAWQQIDGLPEINETLRFAQLARTIARRVRERRLIGASLESFLYLTAPLFRRVKAGSQTIAALVAGSPIGRGPFEVAFRRLLRLLARRRQESGAPTLLARMNRGEISAAPPPPPRIVPASDAVLPAVVQGAPLRPFFSLVPLVGPGFPPPAAQPPSTGKADSPDAALFRAAAVAMLAELHAPRVPQINPVPLLLDDLRTRLTDAADPATAMVQSLQSRLHLAAGFPRAAADPLEPILASPSFDNAMYEPLRQLSEEWILPGVSKFPANTISLAEVNQAFIEAYLLGLSHELGRSLLWHDYPTDQRGTCFRQFWESGGYIGPRTREELRDILPIDAWPVTSTLGGNSSRPPLPNGGQPLVLLIRGDVLRQYPTAVVYAARAQKVAGLLQPADPPVENQPIFRGRLGGDIAFFGFELTAEEARSSATDDGWFFILQEQPNEPRFGLEPGTLPASTLTKWSDLRWADFGSTQIPGYVDLNAALPDTHLIVQAAGDPLVAWHANAPSTDRIGTTSAQLAWITLRRWLRIAIHADQMLAPQ